MTDKELKSFTINYISSKEKENPNYIRYTFYELRIKNNLSEAEVDEFLRIFDMCIKKLDLGGKHEDN